MLCITFLAYIYILMYIYTRAKKVIQNFMIINKIMITVLKGTHSYSQYFLLKFTYIILRNTQNLILPAKM